VHGRDDDISRLPSAAEPTQRNTLQLCQIDLIDTTDINDDSNVFMENQPTTATHENEFHETDDLFDYFQLLSNWQNSG
jgi:hypothetical protein